MSTREKQLLSLLLLAGFIVLNVFLYSLYTQKRTLFQNDLETAKANLQEAIALQDSSAQLAEEMQWLAEYEPEPTVSQPVQSALLSFVDNQARNLGLTVKTQEPLPTAEGVHYDRAQVKISLTGQEQALYSWFNAINDPKAFRAAYQIRLTPNGQDDTLIDCSATIAQWFPPAT
jgi:hypothetical protein